MKKVKRKRQLVEFKAKLRTLERRQQILESTITGLQKALFELRQELYERDRACDPVRGY